MFDGNKMIRMATLPDMYERTITIGSAGKTFSVTGWKLGSATGPEHLIRNCQIVHQNTVYACPTPIQVYNDNPPISNESPIIQWLV